MDTIFEVTSEHLIIVHMDLEQFIISQLNLTAIFIGLYLFVRSIILLIKSYKISSISANAFRIYMYPYLISLIFQIMAGGLYVFMSNRINDILDIIFTVSHIVPLILLYMILAHNYKQILKKSNANKNNYNFTLKK